MGRLPTPLAYRLRTLAERTVFNPICCNHDLPPMFHYWSDTHLRPRFEQLGFSSPEDLFAQSCIRAIAEGDGRTIRIASLGAGRCGLELALAERLEREADGGFRITCIDLNGASLRQARRSARARGLAHRFEFVVADLNQWQPAGQFDVVLANQCLHHLVELEQIFDRVLDALPLAGTFMVSDVIGRNGHRLWPEVEAALEPFFHQLPEPCRYDRTLGQTVSHYQSYDHSLLGFEAIRSQDVLPLLAQRFHFETFAPYGAMTIPLVERRFGSNFDVGNAADRAFVDRLAAREQELLADGRIKPTQLVATLRRTPVPMRCAGGTPAPADCVRRPD